MKKLSIGKRKIMSVLLWIAVSLLLVSGCDTGKKPEDVISKLQTSFDNSDIDMMIECYEPSVQKMYKGIMAIGGAFLGDVDLADVFSGLGGFANIFGSEYTEMPKINITNNKEIVSDEKVKFNVTVEYSYNGDSNKEDMDMYVIKIDGEWYISAKNS